MLPALHDLSPRITALSEELARVAYRAQEAELLKLLDNGALGVFVDKNGNDALMLAADRNLPALVARLMPVSDLSRRNNDGFGALHIAANMSSMECIRLLLRVDDPNRKNPQGHNALMAVLYGKNRFESGARMIASVNLLVPLSDLDTRDNKGRTVLHLAAEAGRAEPLRRLLALKPALAAAQDHEGNTSLHAAASEDAVDCVRLLAPFNDLRAKNNDGLTAADYAMAWGSWAGALALAPWLDVEARERLIASARAKSLGEMVEELTALHEQTELQELLLPAGHTPSPSKKKAPKSL